MECKINWTEKAWISFDDNIIFLLANWTEREVKNFVQITERKITLLAKYPLLGSPKSSKQPFIRCTILHKRILLIYKYKPLKNEIDLMLFWNTNKDPKKIKL